ncbi:tyrosine-type recombinase/integrase [Bacillus thuringiensis]|uniref:tyrosine-type recombinase/integrase n=1 Tax=Bacillus thuringiensis TaxID=1428 RepID=UPI001FAB9E1F|nr:tyrosine-type recombinase/integrase [Bacillus thuringiensis]MDM8365479.1 tyrosine-type recombinase/integrase [Bacillus thuringiensis]
MKKSDIELGEFEKFLFEQGKRPNTVHDYSRHICNFHRWLVTEGSSIHDITRYDIQQYINFLSIQGNQATTITPKYSAIVAYMKFVGKEELLNHINRPEVRHIRNISPKSLSKKQRNRLLREVEKSQNLRNIAIVYTMLYTGVRVFELVGLNRDDVEMKERSGFIIIRDGKGGISRKIPLPAESRYHLQNYLQKRTDLEVPLFLSNFRKRLSKQSAQRIFEQYGIGAHMLRHTYGRELVASGIDLATVADLMGHNDVNTTKRYAAPSMSDLEQAVEKIFNS